MQDIVIEPALQADIPRLIELLAQLFAVEQDFTPDPAAQERGLRLLLAQPPGGSCVLVARDKARKVIGMLTAQTVISTAVGARSVWIEDVVVDEAFRHQGIGTRLIEVVMAWARDQGVARMQLVADADNAPALAFYRQQGWVPTRLYAWKKLLAIRT